MTVTPSKPSDEVRRQAREMQRYSLRPQVSAWAFMCVIWLCMFAVLWAVALPFHPPIEPPAYCGAC